MKNFEPVVFSIEELRTLRSNLWDKKDKLESKRSKMKKEPRTKIKTVLEVLQEISKLDRITQKLAEAIKTQTALEEKLEFWEKNSNLKS